MENSNHKSVNLEPVSPLSQLHRHSFGSNVDDISLQQMNSTSGTSTQVSHEQNPTTRSEANDTAKWPLRYRKRTLFWLFLYLIFLVVPWVFTCILKYRPLNRPSYIDQTFGLSPNDVKTVSRLMRAIRIMNSVATLVTIPFISIVLAPASIVYTQRRRAGQSLSLAQTLALADKRWGDVWFLFRSRNLKNKPLVSKFIWFAATILLLAAFQQPFQQLMVSTKKIQVPTCIDTDNFESTDKSCHSLYGPRKLLGYDPNPSFLNQVPQSHVMQEILRKAAALQEHDIQPNIWSERGSRRDYIGSSTFETTNLGKGTDGLFASSMPELTTTGVLRYHTLRMNSTVACTEIPREQFPTACPGLKPFRTSYSSPSSTGDSAFEVRVCAPGDTTISPWTPTRDTQVIAEEVFLDVFSNIRRVSDTYDLKFTISCKASTTRGYFELGNARNNYTFGPLLYDWLAEDVLGREFNDEGPPAEGGLRLARWDNSTSSPPAFITPLLTSLLNTPPPLTPGPLTTSTLALFGTSSFLSTLFPSTNTTDTSRNLLLTVCRQNTVPFQNIQSIPYLYHQICQEALESLERPSTYDPQSPAMLALSFLRFFEKTGDESKGNYFNTVALLANRALLGAKTGSRSHEGMREVISSPGMEVVVPDFGMAGMVVASVLVGLQVLVLLVVMGWIYRVPTWAEGFDARSLVGVGAGLGREGRVEGVDARDLEVSGIFGGMGREQGRGGVELGLGGEGVVGRKGVR